MYNFQSYRNGPPEEWLSSNHAALSTLISTAEWLDARDREMYRGFVESQNIYKHLTIHVYQKLKGDSRYGSNLAELKQHMASWKSWDLLKSLLRNQEVMHHLQSFPGWNETPQLKKVIALDLDVICASLFKMINDPKSYRLLRNLMGDEAQGMLNLLQTLVDSPYLDPCFRCPFVGALLILSEKSGLFPETLVEDQIILDAGDGVAGGGFSELYTGTFHGRAIAIKVFKFYQTSDLAKYLKAISREALIWRQLYHHHVLPFICLYHTENHPKIGLVSPWMKNGNVWNFLQQVPDADRISLMLDIAKGLDYLHSMRPTIIHGDLKAVNILVTDAQTACLADFGFSRMFDPQIVGFSSWSDGQWKGGSARWAAPELLANDDELVYTTTETDMYAFGYVCYEMFSGLVPFHTLAKDYQITTQIMRGHRPPRPLLFVPSGQDCKSLGLTDEVWSLVQSCSTQIPAGRPTAADVVKHLSVRQDQAITDNNNVFVQAFTNSVDKNIIHRAMSLSKDWREDHDSGPHSTCHPQLWKHRPICIAEYLRNYQLTVIIDDSNDMQPFLWALSCDTLLGIAEHTCVQNVDILEIRFFNSPRVFSGVKGKDALYSIFKEVQPKGRTRTGAALQRVLTEHIGKLNRARDSAGYSTIRPLDIVILTDGVPFPDDRTKDVLNEAVCRLEAGKHHPKSIRIQIVQIGNDPHAANSFKELSNAIKIVEVQLYEPFRTPQALERLLLAPPIAGGSFGHAEDKSCQCDFT